MKRRTLVLSGFLLILLTSLYIGFLFKTVPGLLFSNSNEHSSSSSNTTSNEHVSNSSNATSNEHVSNSSNTTSNEHVSNSSNTTSNELSNSSNTISNTAPKNYNKTLGFEHIYVINLPHRRDRHFKMGDIEEVLELDFEFYPGVSNNDSEILDKYDFNIPLNIKTCYVSHYRVYESIVRNGYNSCLILEDDVDVEMDIISIMTDVYRILPDDWEMLYLGHCNWDGDGKLIGDTGSFQLYESIYPVCTHAYAVTLSGAKKLLSELTEPIYAIDIELMEKITQKRFKSYTMEPSAIVQWKSKDNPSDIFHAGKPWTYPLKKSTLHYLGFQEIKYD
ncbi:4556_t:CDS:1 [Acaulospora morrowiae]|uniref:4556_t:CDS:1 n=1 Tax=Acaulospora morrowiae TaxID=94023 RepID=A0A9N9ADC1_9GLOM|nr:4556_t:CDS:1 [Acaulospora morrowiae]